VDGNSSILGWWDAAMGNPNYWRFEASMKAPHTHPAVVIMMPEKVGEVHSPGESVSYRAKIHSTNL
jgi:hypothetical protein